MSTPAIHVESLGKLYRLGAADTYVTFRETLVNALAAPFRRVCMQAFNGHGRNSEDTIWALRDVSFEIKRGEIVGVIGRNGAGKSTLLKILSRITEPTLGFAEIHGRVGSLLEVGTGFHGELSGRENIYLNGAILGMRKTEIERKFDEIVAFAELEKFIDTPVKRYSSGMYLRLAFAVAAHLEPEILIVDEVLAVGDAAFQKKCLGKMQGVAQTGRTVLFVSHNMAAVENLCQRVIVLQKGNIVFDGAKRGGIDYYYQSVAGEQISDVSASIDLEKHAGRPSNYGPVLSRLEFFNGEGSPLNGGLKMGASLKATIGIRTQQPVSNIDACLGFETLSGQRVFTAHTAFDPDCPTAACVGDQTFICEIPSLSLVPGIYKILVAVGIGDTILDVVEDAARIEVVESDYYGTGKTPWNGLVVLKHHWHLQYDPRHNA